MLKHETIFDVLNEAKERNGLVTISGYQKTSTKTALERKDLINRFFRHTLKALYLIPTIGMKYTKTLTQLQSKELKRLIHEKTDSSITLNAYELFEVPLEKRTPEAFDVYIDFFNALKKEFIKDKEFNAQFVNEVNPVRLDINCDDNKEVEREIRYYIQKPELNIFFLKMAKTLGRIGRWSWFYISPETLYTTKEEMTYIYGRD